MLMRSIRFKTMKQAVTYKRRVNKLGYKASIYDRNADWSTLKYTVFVERIESTWRSVSSYFND